MNFMKNTHNRVIGQPKDEFKNSVANMEKLVKPWRKSKRKNRKGRMK